MRASDLLIRCLENEGVRHVFGVPGEENLDVMDALSDDLNTPLAVTLLHGLAKTDPAALKSAANLLGLLTLPKEDWQKLRARSKPAIDPARIESLIAARNAARAARDFGESDRIRDALAAMGVTLKDGPDGTRWEI